MATLLSLRPSRSIEEQQVQSRKIILNSPALPSSCGLLTSFGGLKKEESLSKTSPISRSALGIMIKKNKLEESGSEEKESNKFESETKMDEIVSSKDFCTKLKADLDQKKEEKFVSLVGDYSSSGESSE